MRRELVAAFAALLLAAACESLPDTSAGAVNAGVGAGGAQGAGQGTVTATPGGGAPPAAATPPRTGPTPGTVQQFTVEVGDRVLFDFDRSDLTPTARATLERQAAWLRLYPNARVQIEGHADERGTREYNLALGARRAQSVVTFLTSAGIAGGRITTISYGKERPAVLGSNDTAWSQNRRGVTAIQSGVPTN